MQVTAPVTTPSPSPATDNSGVLDKFIPAMIKPVPVEDFLQISVTSYCRIFAAFKNGATNLETAYRMAWSDQAIEESALNVAVGPKEGPTSPSNRGTIFHSVMETSGFDLDLVGYKSLVIDRATWHGFEPSEDEIEFLAEKAYRFQMSEYGQELKRTMDEGLLYRREWPFWIKIGKDENNFGPIQLSGVVDLFYINKKGQGKLIDFKLAKAGHSLTYEKQLEIYALAIKKAGFSGDLESKIWYSGA
jgi:hypothetical protein